MPAVKATNPLFLLSNCLSLPRKDSALHAESTSLLAEKVPVAAIAEQLLAFFFKKCCSLLLDVTVLLLKLPLSSMSKASCMGTAWFCVRQLTGWGKRERFPSPSSAKLPRADLPYPPPSQWRGAAVMGNTCSEHMALGAGWLRGVFLLLAWIKAYDSSLVQCPRAQHTSLQQ